MNEMKAADIRSQDESRRQPSVDTGAEHTYTYIPLTLYPRRGRRFISDIPKRHPRFTKIT
jgi:hypothetical protein